MWLYSFPSTIYRRDHPFPIEYSWLPCQRLVDHTWIYFQAFDSVPLVCVYFYASTRLFWLLWQGPAQLRKPGGHSHALIFPMGEITGWGLLVTEPWYLGGGVVQVTWNWFSFPLQYVQLQISFPKTVLKLSTGLLDFHKGTLIHAWLSQLVFFVRKMAGNSCFIILIS